MEPPPDVLLGIIGDILCSLVIVISSFWVFRRTKEYYELSAHEGLKYFRYAFLFFSISFLAQIARPILHELHIPQLRYIIPFFVFAGTMAMLCLLYSVLWKRLHWKRPMMTLGFVSLAVAAIAVSVRLGPVVILILHLLLFSTALIISYRDARTHKKKAFQTHILYTLLFLGWIANAMANFALWRFAEVSLLLNAISAVLFIVLLRRVLRRTP